MKQLYNSIKLIIQLLLQCSKKSFIKIVAINLLIGILTPIQLIIAKAFLEQLSLSYPKVNLKILGLILLVECLLIFLGDLFAKLSHYYDIYLIERLNIYVSETLIDITSKVEMSKFSNKDFYDNLTEIERETTPKSTETLNCLINLVKMIASTVGVLIILIKFNILIVIGAIILAVPSYFITQKYSKNRQVLIFSRFEDYRLATKLKELFLNLDSIKEIRLYKIASFLKDKIIEKFNKFLIDETEISKKHIRDTSLFDLMEILFDFGLKIYIIITCMSHEYQVASIIMYFSTYASFKAELGSLLNVFSRLQVNSLFLNGLKYVFESKNNEQNKNGLKINKIETIEFCNVSFRYINSSKYVLKNINLKFVFNQTYFLVGLNGSGKTTFINLLLGLYFPTKGHIYINGVDIHKIDLASYYENIGVVFQNYLKLPLDVKHNIAIGNISDIVNIDKIIEIAKVSDSLDFINCLQNKFQTLVQSQWTDGIELSGGQWQKLAIGRALMRPSKLLVLDEPTSSLDAEAEVKVLGEIIKNRKNGQIQVIASHKTSSARFYGHIIVLKHGEIAEMGPYDKLMERKGVYYDLLNMKIEDSSIYNDVKIS